MLIQSVGWQPKSLGFDNMAKTALITGVSGQDGSYLAELLLTKGYQVIGTVRDVESAHEKLGKTLSSQLNLVAWDYADSKKLHKIITQSQPTEIYNLAAFSSGAGMFDEPLKVSEINGLLVTMILEAIRACDPSIRFCQASSREVFGEPMETPQNENTVRNPRSPYGAAKLYADNMIKIYRERYNTFACSAILFNHESPRRGLNFVTRKITHEAVRIKLGLSKELRLGNLETRRDWGYAGDTVRAMWMMLQHDIADDYLVATGITHTVEEFCEQVFNCLELNFNDYVKEDSSAFRPSEPVALVGDISKIKNTLGWYPNTSFEELIQMMVDAELRHLKHNHKTI